MDAKPPAKMILCSSIRTIQPQYFTAMAQVATVHVTSSLYTVNSIQKPVQNPAQREVQSLSDKCLLLSQSFTHNMGERGKAIDTRTKQEMLINMVPLKRLPLHSHTCDRYSKSALVLLRSSGADSTAAYCSGFKPQKQL